MDQVYISVKKRLKEDKCINFEPVIVIVLSDTAKR